jgi:hypothetical protein
MSESKGTVYVTMRARRPFLYRGKTVEAGDLVTLPIAEAQRLRRRNRYVEHLLDKNIRAKMYSTTRRAMELYFD